MSDVAPPYNLRNLRKRTLGVQSIPEELELRESVNLKKPKPEVDTQTTGEMTEMTYSDGEDSDGEDSISTDRRPEHEEEQDTAMDQGLEPGRDSEMVIVRPYSEELFEKISTLGPIVPPEQTGLTQSNSSTIKSVFDKINNILYKNLLAGSDSIHDFKPTRCGDKSACDNVATKLLIALNSLQISDELKFSNTNNLTEAKDIYSNWLKTAFAGGVTSSSDNENQTVDYFETKFPYELVQETITLTYREIRDDILLRYNNGNSGIDINTAINNSKEELVGNATVLNLILAVDETPKDWEKYDLIHKTYIGMFILNFYFPPPTDGGEVDVSHNSKNPTYFTFDAVSEIVSNIFGSMDQAVNLVTPLNIADSAKAESHLIPKTDGKRTASAKRNGVKNFYFFPVSNPGTNLYNYDSNIYTKNILNLSLVPPTPLSTEPWTYNERNKYDFEIQINNQTNFLPTTNYKIIFDSDNKSGPSVGYLSSLVAIGNGTPDSKMINLQAMYNYLVGVFSSVNAIYILFWLLFDLKRTGDWEQCNAAKKANEATNEATNGRTILCTGDRLCALYSRCIGQNTLYQLTTADKRTLNLFRFSTGSGGGSNISYSEKLLKKLKKQSDIWEEIKQKINDIIGSFTDDNINNLKRINFPNSNFLQDMVTKLIGQTLSAVSYDMTPHNVANSNIDKISYLLDTIGTFRSNNNPLLNDYRFINLIYNETLSIPDELKQNLNKLSEIFGYELTAELIQTEYNIKINPGSDEMHVELTPHEKNKIKNTTNYIDFFDNLKTKIDSSKKIDFKLGLCDFGMLHSIEKDISFLIANTASDRNLQKEDYDVKLKNYIRNLQYIYDNICNPPYDEKCILIQNIINTKYEMPIIEPFILAIEQKNRISANRNYKETLEKKTNILIESYLSNPAMNASGGQSTSKIKKIIKGGAVADKNLLDNLETFLVN